MTSYGLILETINRFVNLKSKICLYSFRMFEIIVHFYGYLILQDDVCTSMPYW